MSEVNLFTPSRINGFETSNRIMMAPMTRSRANPGAIPSDLAIDYYTQRASAGLIISEGTALVCCRAGLCPYSIHPHNRTNWRVEKNC